MENSNFIRQEYKLKKLVIKPTLACTANCPTCQLRRELHKSLAVERKLSFEQWLAIFDDANKLGTERLDISGGEPTLYRKLPDLIKAAKRYGWYVNVNSNGSLITEDYAKQLLEAGMNSISLSLYSHIPQVHDQMRNCPGLWEKVTRAIKIFSGMAGQYPRFEILTQSLLCRENHQNLAELLELHYKLGSNRLAFTYLEGDFDRRYLLNEDEIKYFIQMVMPKARAFCQTLDPSIRDKAVSVVENIYSPRINSSVNFAAGLYRPKESNPSPCQRPKDFTILLANGDVHPCNMVEYTHEPVMGNLFEKSLPEIWRGDKWNRFREQLFDYCHKCPINLYMGIPLRPQAGVRKITSTQGARKYAPISGIVPTTPHIVSSSVNVPARFSRPDLQQSQYWPYEKLLQFQNDRLALLMNYVYANIPGYRRKFDEDGIKPADIKSINDLHKLRITTRQELQDNPDFVNQSYVCGTMYTGGSTGASLRYYESEDAGIIRLNAHQRGWKWGGFETGMKYCILKSAQSFVTENNRLYLIGDLTEENLARNLKAVQDFKPQHLKGYVGSLYIFAKYCLDNGVQLKDVISVIPSSENLYDYQRQVMEQAFGCKVFEEYCCNDGGACAWECERREGLHHVMERAIIEDIDGKMIVTDLWNYAMPFVRYENGDSVKFTDEKCSCGRELPLIKVKGRTNDIIITSKGVITPSFLLHHGIGLVGVDKKNQHFRSGIRAIQYVQKPGSILQVNVVRNPWCTDADIANLKKDLNEFIGGLEIKLNFVEVIPTTKKGKTAFIINEDRKLLETYLHSASPDDTWKTFEQTKNNASIILPSRRNQTQTGIGDQSRINAAAVSKVSVLMCVYNAEKYIAEALQSLYRQTFQNFEVIIVDDASTDRTPEILLKMKDSRTSIYRNSENKGLTKSLNIGLKLCRGEYVARMDADDISLPQRFEKQVKFLDENSSCLAVGSWCLRVDCDNKILHKWTHPTEYEDIKKSLLIRNSIFHGSAMARRIALVKIGGYNENYQYSQDYDLWLRLSETGEIRNLPEYLYASRVTPEGISITRRKQQDEYAELARQQARQRKPIQASTSSSETFVQKPACRQSCENTAVDYFLNALGEFNAGNFQKAAELVSAYEKSIDFSKFLRRINNSRKKESIDVSVVVVTYNRTDDVRKCLESLEKQDDLNFEVIVVDNGGTDYEQFKQYVDQYIKCPINLQLSEGRNIGACCAKGRILAFLDDDAVVPPDYISSIKTAFKTHDIAGLRGKALPKSKPDANKNIKNYDKGNIPFPTFCDLEGSSAFLRKVYLAMDGMDPLLFGHEGSDLTYRIAKKLGAINKVIYWPGTAIYHDAILGESKRQREEKYKLMDGYLKWKHNDNIFALRQYIEKQYIPGPPELSDPAFGPGTPISLKDLKLHRLGSEYGGFVVALDLIIPGSTIISAGVGEDISFDLELIRQKNCKVVGIDPCEKARKYVERNRYNNYEFIPKALYSRNHNSVTMYRSSRPDYVSESVSCSHRSVASSDSYQAGAISVEELLKEYPDISLLKMDIEGAEYEVLNAIEMLNIPQICLEFHHFCTSYTPQDTCKCIEHIKAIGYEVVHCKDEAGAPREVTFVHKRCLSPSEKPAAPVHTDKIEVDVPVVVVVYNRPKHTLEVLKALKQHDIKNLYIFSDAPKRKEHEQDVSLVRRLIHSIDWTTPKIIEREENLGLAKSIVSAADYVFEKHDRLILLEDDCVPQQHFFDFIHTCLEKYRDNPKVFGVSGYSVSVPGQLLQKYPYDLYFSPRIGSWGWATWKRAWQHYGRDLRELIVSANEKKIDLSQGGNDIPIAVERFLKGQLKDVWTLNWVLSVYLNNGYYIYPTRSHIDNVGMDGTGLHCGKTDKYNSPCATAKPERYPGEVVIDAGIIDNFKGYYKADAEQSRRATTFLTSIGRKNPERKIAMVSTTDNRGGAARVAWMLKNGLVDRGFGTKMFVSEKFSGDADVYKISNPGLDRTRELERRGLLYYDIKSTSLLAHNRDFTSCDVFHFHNLHGGYFNPFALPGLTRLKPSVWTLHDMQALTGHCAYAFDCDKWQTGCGNCPNLGTYPAVAIDQTARMWEDKRRIYAESNVEIIVPSQWLKDAVAKSILKDKKVHLIYNGIDERIYRPYDKSAVRRQLKLPEDAIVIGFVSHKGLLEQRKGSDFILEAYKYFIAKYPNLYFLCIGGKSENAPKERLLQIPFVTDESILAQIYCAADVFMFPTLADNCPLIVLELMGCGVPIVSFEVGGVPELIEHGKTGFLAPYKNIGELIHLTEQLVLDEAGRRRFSQAASERLRERFTLDRMIDNHIRLYDSLTQKRLSGQPEQGDAKPVISAGQTSKQNRYLVSAIVSTYNSEKFIRGCIEDLENQTIADRLEIIVVNSGSEQNEESIVEEFQKKYGNIVYIKTEREGLYSAWNRAVKVASGQFLTNANTDDRHRKDAFEVMANTLLKNTDVALVYGDQIVTDTPNPTFENHHVIELAQKPEFSKERLLFNCCVGSQPMWRKSMHDEFGGFDETLTCAADWDFWLKVAGKYYFKHIPEFLGFYFYNTEGIEHGRRIHGLYERYFVGRRYNKQYMSGVPLYEARGNPLVSIVMAAYNAAGYIARAIESVLIQNYRNFELIVVDDGSTDRTAEIVRGFKNEPIKYFYKENGGVSSARNYALKKVSGSFVVILDSDDMITPDFIARHLMVFEEHPETDLVYCDDCFIDDNDKPIRVMNRPEYSDQKAIVSALFHYGWAVLPFRTCIRKSVFDKIGLYDERLIMSEDYDMLRRFVSQGLRMRHLPAALYLRHPTVNSLSRSFNAAKAKGHFEVVHKFTEVFTVEQLFPDVRWDKLPAEQKLLLAKCKTAIVYLGIGEQYLASNAPDFAEAAFEMACAEMDDCCKIEPADHQVRNLREKCLAIRDKHSSSGSRGVYQTV